MSIRDLWNLYFTNIFGLEELERLFCWNRQTSSSNRKTGRNEIAAQQQVSLSTGSELEAQSSFRAAADQIFSKERSLNIYIACVALQKGERLLIAKQWKSYWYIEKRWWAIWYFER